MPANTDEQISFHREHLYYSHIFRYTPLAPIGLSLKVAIKDFSCQEIKQVGDKP